jgi:hypothetical protein
MDHSSLEISRVGDFQDAAPAFVEANFGPCSLENNDSQIVRWVVLLRRLEAWRIDAVLAMSCDFSLACFLQSFIAQGPRRKQPGCIQKLPCLFNETFFMLFETGILHNYAPLQKAGAQLGVLSHR